MDPELDENGNPIVSPVIDEVIPPVPEVPEGDTKDQREWLATVLKPLTDLMTGLATSVQTLADQQAQIAADLLTLKPSVETNINATLPETSNTAIEPESLSKSAGDVAMAVAETPAEIVKRTREITRL